MYKRSCFKSSMIAILLSLSFIISGGLFNIAHAQDPIPTGWWKLDDGSGATAFDSSGNGYNGAFNGNASWSSSSMSGPYCAIFTPNGYIDIPTPVVDTAKSFTVACWVKMNGLGGFQTFLSIDGNQVSGFFLQLRGDTGAFAFTRLNSDTPQGAVYASCPVYPEIGTWYHIAGVYNADTQKLSLYVNGVLQQSVSFTSPWTATGHTAIGRGFYNGGIVDFVNASIDDARIYNQALSASQIATLAAGAPPIPPTSVSIPADQSGISISPMLYGLMIEDINHSIDGGLYAETITNRAFKDNGSSPTGWSLIQPNGATAAFSLDTSAPVPNTALTASGRLDITSVGSSMGPGITNGGYWGIPVRPNTTYQASLYAKADNGFNGPLTLQIVSTSGQVYATATIPQITTSWAKYAVALNTGADIPVTKEAQFVIYAGSTGSVWLTQISLMPPAYNNRPNGSRVDIMNMLAAMNPAFLRLPGGNYLEGWTIDDRFEWTNTIGDISLRPGHNDPWGYRSNDGYGLLEYLEWCEDLGMSPVLAVYAGYSLNGAHINPGTDLAPYVQDALNELEYATGSTSTPYGAQRALDGHPAPFNIHYVEIGNEDWFDGSGSYDGRFTQFYNAIKTAYPNLQLIATSHSVSSVTPDLYDDHYYWSPQSFQNSLHMFDGYSRSGPKTFIGEWASQEGAPTPDMNSALGDATFLLGMERNSDVVVMESYAPLLVNVNSYQWGTNLIGFDALNSYGSPSYYVQMLFGRYHGDHIVPAVSSSNMLIYDASKDTKTGTIYLKLINPWASPSQLNISVSSQVTAASGIAYTLSANDLQATNTINNPQAIVPVTSTFPVTSGAFSYTLPGYAVAVLVIKQAKTAAPVISPASGIYNAGQTITLSDTTAGAAIYYTTDSTIPTPSSTVYTGSFTINKGTTVNAVALASGYALSDVISAAYIINPAITSLSPSTISGAKTFTLTVNGTNFVSGSIIKWNGTNMTTTYVSSTQLTTTINKYYTTLSSYPGSATISVLNPDGGRSAGAKLAITTPLPAISSLSPSSIKGATTFTLSVNGSNFVSGSIIKWNGTNLATTFLSATQLTASINKYYDTLTSYPGSATISVLNPDGGRSTGATLTITQPITPPAITSLSPSSIKGAATFTLTVNGTGFQSGAVIKWNGTNMTTTYVSPTQLTATINKYYDTLASYPGSASISVLNPDSGRSAGVTLAITSP